MQSLKITPINDILTAKYNIELWLIDKENFEFYQSTNYLFNLNRDQFSFTIEFYKLIFSYWTDSKSESWQLIKYKLKKDLLYFDVYIPFSKGALSFLLKEVKINNLKLLPSHFDLRKNYLFYLSRLINENFPNLKINKANISNNPSINNKVGLAKLLLSQDKLLIAAVGMSKYEKKDSLKTLLAEALRWLSILQTQFNPISIDKLMIFAPSQIVELLAERLTLIIEPKTKIELFEFDEIKGVITFVNPFDQGYLALSLTKNIKLPVIKTKLKTKLNFKQTLDLNIDEQIEWIKSLAPNLIEIELTTNQNKLSLHINGLIFATACLKSQNISIKFGFKELKEKLTLENRPKLESLVKEIALYRNHNSLDKQHQYYQTLAESWLERVIKCDLSCLDPNLLNCFYSQVPVSKEYNKFIDFLAVDKYGQLVIIELKVVESIDLVFQGLDYWLRIEWYRFTNELSLRGYFPNVRLKNIAAKIYLVTPRLRSHENLRDLASLVDKRATIYWIAINDNWRECLKVESRERLN